MSLLAQGPGWCRPAPDCCGVCSAALGGKLRARWLRGAQWRQESGGPRPLFTRSCWRPRDPGKPRLVTASLCSFALGSEWGSEATVPLACCREYALIQASTQGGGSETAASAELAASPAVCGLQQFWSVFSCSPQARLGQCLCLGFRAWFSVPACPPFRPEASGGPRPAAGLLGGGSHRSLCVTQSKRCAGRDWGCSGCRVEP